MKSLLGDEYPAFLASYDDLPDIGLRVNTLKLTPQEFSALLPNLLTPNPLTSQLISPSPQHPSTLTPILWCPSGFTLPPASRPGKHPYHAAGLYYLQDPSAMAVAELLAPQPGERILDLAAAPGGKSTHIAALMQGEGLLVANDIHPRRVRSLANNLERCGVRNAVITNETPPRLAEHFGDCFDRVLVDAPCSGEGMFRKDPSARGEWTPKLVQSCALRQDAILWDAARLVRPGGLLVYSTCTFAPEEDEGTLARLLGTHPEFELVAAPQFPGFAPGRPAWLDEAESFPELKNAVRLWPHRAPGEGHFIALLRRAEERGSFKEPRSGKFAPLPFDARKYFEQFCAETFQVYENLAGLNLALMGAYLYAIPPVCPDLRGLRVVHWGWWLGTLKKKRFEPSHALALGLHADDARQTFSLTAADPRALAYLHGEVLPSPGPNGWVLVTVNGFPLGWGKRVQGRLKSHSPKWLRWM